MSEEYTDEEYREFKEAHNKVAHKLEIVDGVLTHIDCFVCRLFATIDAKEKEAEVRQDIVKVILKENSDYEEAWLCDNKLGYESIYPFEKVIFVFNLLKTPSVLPELLQNFLTTSWRGGRGGEDD